MKNEVIKYYLGGGLALLFGLIFLPRFLPLMINADSYAILLPTKLWQEYGYIGGQLGEGGDLFYPLFYRGGLSMVIFGISFFLKNIDTFLVISSLTVGSYLLSGILIYDIGYKLFRSSVVGLVMSMLLYLSFSFHSWSGVAMAETMTIMLFLAVIDSLLSAKNNIGWYLVSAVLMGTVMMFRLEMAVLLVGMWVLIGEVYKKDFRFKFLYLLIVFLVWLNYELLIYLLVSDPVWWISDQIVRLKQTFEFHQLFWQAGLILAFTIWLTYINKWLIVLPIGGVGIVLWQLNLDWYNVLKPILEFIRFDLAIVLLALVSWGWMSFKKSKVGIVTGWWILMLIMVYFSREEYRYYVHLVAILVIMSGYLVAVLWKNSRVWVRIVTIILVVIMIGGQYYTVKSNNFLPEYGYEQVVVEYTKEILVKEKSENLVVCSKFSEAMYFVTNAASVDCFDGLSDLERINDQSVMIVVDEDMARHQAEFVGYLEQSDEFELLAERWVIVPYVEKNNYSIPQYPVRWFVKK